MVKYRIETFTRHHVVCRSTPLEENCSYDNLPHSLMIPEHRVILDFWHTHGSDFLPLVESEEDPDKVWSHNKRSDWYTHVETDIRVKLEYVKSLHYDDSDTSEGTCTTTLTVKVPLPSERGKNPNSHHNKPKMPDTVAKDINLTPGQWEQVEKLGNGKGYSQGIRELLKAV